MAVLVLLMAFRLILESQVAVTMLRITDVGSILVWQFKQWLNRLILPWTCQLDM